MDLLTLAAKIELDDSSYTKGVSNAEKVGKQLAGKLNAMTVAVGNITADMIRKAAGGVKQIIGGAVDAYADYQQLIGGVETLFKENASKVENYAKQSFKTTGLSANQYMETVTSFSASLLQGLKGNTEEAADLANMAVTDMADNANKMGTDISAIQAAYQGFAKANFTMLDNLKLGYGGTRGEMVRLINDSGILESEIKDLDGITFDQLVQAIHVVQTELGITGTTAAEARDTISGSKASLKAAWDDMLASAGGKSDEEFYQSLDNFKSSFSTYMTNFIPSLILAIKSSGQLSEAIAEAVVGLPENLLAQIGEAGLDSGTDMIGAASKFTSWLITSMTNIFKSASADPSHIKEFGAAIGDFIGTAMKDIATNAPAIVTGMIDAGIALAGGLVEGLFQGLFGQNAEVDKITEQLQENITNVDVDSAKAGALVKYIQGLTDKYGDAVTQTDEFKKAAEELEQVLPGAGVVFTEYGEDIQGATDKLNDLIATMRQTAIQAGMTKALNEEYELLGQQRTKKAQAEYTADIYAAERSGLETILRESSKAYAEEFINKYSERAKSDGDIAMQIADAKSFLDDLNQGLATAEDMTLAAEMYGNYIKGKEGENIWDKSKLDNIVDPSELANFSARVAELTAGVEDALNAAKDTQKEIDATEQQIAITEAAVNAAMEDSFNGAASGVQSGGQAVAGALEGAAGAISSIKIPSSIGGGEGSGTGEATGMDYVPYDGFRAELHRGEAVLTKGENIARRNGYDYLEMASAMEDALIAALKKVDVNMDGQKVGNMTTAPVSRNSNASKKSVQRGMGG